MSKIIITSDWHIHKYNQYSIDNSRLFIILNWIEWLFKFSNKNGIKHILFAGDMFNNFDNLSVIVLNNTIRTFKKIFGLYPDIEFYYITGNHDMAELATLNNTEHSLFVLQELFQKNFKSLCYPNKLILDDITFIGFPYVKNPQEILDTLQTINVDTKHLNLLTHQMITQLIPVANDFDIFDAVFNKVSYVFNGHVHHFETLSHKFINIGNPYHRDLGDYGDRKYIIVLETETNEWQPYDVTNKSPIFIKKKPDEPISEDEKNNFIVIESEKVDMDTGDFNDEEFSVEVDDISLVKNYWKTVSNDTKLLEVGINLITKKL